MERYEAYKNSGIEWIGALPDNWSINKLGNLGRYINGYAFKPGQWSDSGLPIIRIQDLTGSNDSPNYYEGKIDTKYLVNEGDLLVSWAATIGVYWWSRRPGWLNQHIFRVIPYETICVKQYFYWMLNAAIDALDNENKHGIMMEHLTSSVFDAFRVPVPPISEQRAIAEYLGDKIAEVDALVSDCEREVELLREYRKAVISESVTRGLDPDAPTKDSGVEWIGEIPEGWFCSSLNRVIKTIQTGPFGSQLHAEDYTDDGDVCVVNPANIVGGKILTSSCNRISNELANTLSQHMMHKGEIVFGRRGEMGRCALVEEDGLFCGTGSIEMELLETALPAFAVYYLQCDFVKSYLELRSVGTTLQNLNTVIIAATPFVVAPVEEQCAIVAHLDAKTAEIDSLIEAKQALADKLREYRRSLISEAVTGKFKVPGV